MNGECRSLALNLLVLGIALNAHALVVTFRAELHSFNEALKVQAALRVTSGCSVQSGQEKARLARSYGSTGEFQQGFHARLYGHAVGLRPKVLNRFCHVAAQFRGRLQSAQESTAREMFGAPGGVSVSRHLHEKLNGNLLIHRQVARLCVHLPQEVDVSQLLQRDFIEEESVDTRHIVPVQEGATTRRDPESLARTVLVHFEDTVDHRERVFEPIQVPAARGPHAV